MLKKRRFLAVNSSISGGAGSKVQSETRLSPLATSLVCENGCLLPNFASHCEQEYKTCYYLKITMKNDKI